MTIIDKTERFWNWTRRLCVCLVFLSVSVFAGKYANAFLEIGAGARGLGLGGALVANTEDAFSFYWNPAGLASVNRVQISGMYGPQFGTISDPLATYHQAGLSLPIRGGAVIGINWVRLAVDDIPVYAELQGNSYYDRLIHRQYRPTGEPEGSIQDSEDAFFLSFAKQNEFNVDFGWAFHRVRVEIPFGLNLKLIKQKLGDQEASGLGVDFGVLMRLRVDDLLQIRELGKLGVGLHLQDLTRTNMNWGTKRQDTVPINVLWGLAYTQEILGRDGILTFCYERESRWEAQNRLGLEFLGWQSLALRFGAVSGKIRFGAGLHIFRFFVDYAFEPHDLNGLHRISLIVTL